MQTADNPAGALVGALHEAEFVTDGEFRVDAGRASDKLDAFRLADPAAWIVVLLEGAIAAGVRTVHVQFRRREIEIELRNFSLGEAELGALDAILVSAPADHQSRAHALYLLGIGVNAARARADALLLETGDRRLRWTPADETVDALTPREHTGVLVEIDDGGDEERRLLHERCGFAQIDLFIDEVQIAWGWRRAFGGRASPLALLPCPDPEILRIDDEVTGLAGFHFESCEGASLVVLRHGIVAERLDLGGPATLRRGFVTIVEAPDLGRDLGLARVTRDARFEALLAHVERERARLHERHDAVLVSRRTRRDAASQRGLHPTALKATLLLLVLAALGLVAVLT